MDAHRTSVLSKLDVATDSDAAPKTMLGREQLTWLKDTLAASDATWNVIVSSVPIQSGSEELTVQVSVVFSIR